MKIKIKGKIETNRIWLNGKELTPEESQKIKNHSPDGFSWGYSGSGPSQLALAILLKLYSEDIAQSNYQEFKSKVIATLPKADFEAEVNVDPPNYELVSCKTGPVQPKLGKLQEMFFYEFVTPSDSITFKADDDRVAFTCALLLGNGKAGCHRRGVDGNKVNLETMLMFCNDSQVDQIIEENLGMGLSKFLDENGPVIAECFLSFAYGNIEDRKTYDDALSAITDEKKRKEFKSKHEDRNRTSMSKWVQSAWNIGEKIKKKSQTTEA